MKLLKFVSYFFKQIKCYTNSNEKRRVLIKKILKKIKLKNRIRNIFQFTSCPAVSKTKKKKKVCWLFLDYPCQLTIFFITNFENYLLFFHQTNTTNSIGAKTKTIPDKEHKIDIKQF